MHPEYWLKYTIWEDQMEYTKGVFKTVKYYTHSIIKCYLAGKKFSIVVSHKYNLKKKK